uniref:DExH-box helicase 58 n=1 Tax=Prolemur simus TaxID=1328070 RepID=A0A8C9DL53_PROSS
MELRPYQWEVIMPALEGKNIIIWLPTGAGKTRAAAYVAKRHLETVDGAKVVVLVNRVHLVTQHGEEFSRMLDGRWTMTTLRGDMGPRAGFGHLARCHDLLICTAELLQMALTSTEEEEHVELTAFSLLIVDECHHTHKDTVYNVILSRYLENKLWRARPIPQVLGLTASPGTGRASKLDGAIDHILQLCANLDTWRIMSPQNSRPQLQEHNQRPCKQYDLCNRRSQSCASALGFLADHKNALARLATHSPENPKLEILEKILRKQFSSPNSPRGIIFTRTRQSAHSLLLWLQQQPGLRTMDIRAQLLIGAGNNSQSTHMTQRNQEEVIQKFRAGTLNLLVATSVAEEGLDIPQCNVVVRYGLLTNEISMVQARGRARAGQSVYSFVAAEGSRELRRELTNEALETLMEQAVAAVQNMDEAEYQAKIRDLQQAALVKRAAQAAQRESRRQQFSAEHVQLLCINCMVAVGYGRRWKAEDRVTPGDLRGRDCE